MRDPKMADPKRRRSSTRPGATRPSVISIASLPSVTHYRRSTVASRKGMPSMDRLEKLEKDRDKILTKRDKVIYTMINNYIHLLFGLTLSSMAPAFVDYKAILHTEMQWIGLFPMFQAIGIFTGSFMTASYKWLNRQVTLSCLIVIQGLGTMFQPWATQLWQLYICIFFYGFGVGAWNGANNVILIEMWQDKSPSMLQFSQFIYGVGTILGPLLDQQFVLGEQVCPGYFEEDVDQYCRNNGTICSDCIISNSTSNLTCYDCENYDRRPQLKIPLMIGGCLQMIGPLLMMTMYFIKPYYFDPSSSIEVAESEEDQARHKKYVPTKTIIVCISLYLAFGIMGEMMYMDFAPTFYQFCEAKLSASRASQMFGIIAIALTVGRGLSIFIAMKLEPWLMIAYQSVIVFCGFVFQYFGQGSYTLLLASSLVICFGYSSIFICLFSFVDQYMEVTDKIGGLFIGSYNAVYMFLPYFVGKYIEIYAPSFLFILIGSFSVAMLSFVIVMIAVWNVPKDLIRKMGPVAAH